MVEQIMVWSASRALLVFTSLIVGMFIAAELLARAVFEAVLVLLAAVLGA